MEQTPAHGQAARTLRQLAELGWLAEQPADFQARIATIGHWVNVARGAPLYTEHEHGATICGLGEGLLDVSVAVSPAEEVIIHRAGPGFWIGDSAVLAGAARTLTVRAVAPSRVFQLPAAAVHRLLQDRPSDWPYFCRLSHRNATLAIQVLAEVLTLRPKVRFARLLLRLAGPDGTVRATQDELGGLAGMSRAAFRRALGQLIASGVVVTGYGGVRITDMDVLRSAARGD